MQALLLCLAICAMNAEWHLAMCHIAYVCSAAIERDACFWNFLSYLWNSIFFPFVVIDPQLGFFLLITVKQCKMPFKMKCIL